MSLTFADARPAGFLSRALIVILLVCPFCFAQSEKEAAVLEIGPAASWSLTEGQSAFGPTVAVEATPIENWLELEAGVTPIVQASFDRVERRPLVQEAVDAVGQERVYDWGRP